MNHEEENSRKEGVPELSDSLQTISKDDFCSLSNEWFETNKIKLKLSTQSKYRNILKKYICPFFQGKSACELVRSDISQFISLLLNSRSENGKELAPKTVSCILSVLRQIVAYIR